MLKLNVTICQQDTLVFNKRQATTYLFYELKIKSLKIRYIKNLMYMYVWLCTYFIEKKRTFIITIFKIIYNFFLLG